MDRIDDFDEIKDEQDTAVSDDETKTEKIQTQVENDPEVEQSHESFLQPKAGIATLMDKNTEAEPSNSSAKPTNTNKVI